MTPQLEAAIRALIEDYGYEVVKAAVYDQRPNSLALRDQKRIELEEEIYRLKVGGMKFSEIAARVKVSKNYAGELYRRHKWKVQHKFSTASHESDPTLLESLNLSVRTFNALKGRGHITTVQQAFESAKSGEAWSIRNFGDAGIGELITALRARGFDL